MSSKESHFFVYYILFYIGGASYVGIELLYRQHSHWTMFLVGGLCFLAVGSLDEIVKKPLSLILQGFVGAGIITCIEFISGCVINLQFKLNVWDYSNLPFNLLGQVCLPFYFMWIPLALLCVVANNQLLYDFHIKSTKPVYHLFLKGEWEDDS